MARLGIPDSQGGARSASGAMSPPSAPAPGSAPAGARRWLWPLRSRKVQVALATVLAAYLLPLGIEVSSELLATVIAVGVALILGIAVEDAGAGGG
jgi:hypothetical protein